VTLHAAVDCEHHVIVERLDDLAPYLSEGWLARLSMGEFAMPRPGPHPGAELEAGPVPGGADPVNAAAALAPETTHAVLIPSQPLVSSGWLGGRMAAVFSSAVNDYVVDRWLPADSRFHFALTVAPHDGDAAAAEIHRLGSHAGAVGVCLSPIQINLGQMHYRPIFEAAAEYDLAVIVHPGGFEGNVVGPAALGGVGPRTPEDTFCLLAQVAMSAISSLVFDGTLEQFPQLRVVLAGFGFGWAPPVMWRMDSEWRGLRIEVPWLTRAPSEVIADQVRFVVDAAVERDPGTWMLAEMLPAGSLVHGSDVPFQGGGPGVLKGCGEDLRGRILSANALDTFQRLKATATIAS
jgi:predicted TIM-barrel fold metal-dependent hydrolase